MADPEHVVLPPPNCVECRDTCVIGAEGFAGISVLGFTVTTVAASSKLGPRTGGSEYWLTVHHPDRLVRLPILVSSKFKRDASHSMHVASKQTDISRKCLIAYCRVAGIHGQPADTKEAWK